MVDKIFLKRAVVPLWVVQLIILIWYTISSSLALWVVSEAQQDIDEQNVQDPQLNEGVEDVNITAAVFLAVTVLTIIMDLVEIVLVARHRLGPVANIVMQSIKSTIWTILLVLTIAASVTDGSADGVAIFLALAMFATCMGQLIYGAVIVHRHRKGTLYRGTYAAAEAGYGNTYSTTHYDPPRASYNTHNPSSLPAPNPFRDASPAPSLPQQTGAVSEYYGNVGAQHSYEMQQRY